MYMYICPQCNVATMCPTVGYEFCPSTSLSLSLTISLCSHKKCWQLYQEYNLNVKLMTFRVCWLEEVRFFSISQLLLSLFLWWTTEKTDDFSSWQNANDETEVQQSKQIYIEYEMHGKC